VIALRCRRVVIGLAAGLLGSTLITSPTFADPPGPTDYQSEIVSVEPPTPTVLTSIVGGDSFFELTVAPGTEVFVVGYQGEDTLWFRTDGTVWENRNSPSVHLNADRLGGGGIPDTATADAEPDWTRVAADGNYAWHDHRAHWMQQARPFGLGPGDQILESVIPLVVDGTDVEVTVISTWQPAPSPLSAIAGFAVGLGLAVAAWFLHRARRYSAAVAVAMPVALLALIVGVWQFRSLPPETGPKLVWWVLPLVAVFSASFGILAAKRSMTFAADATMLLVGVELAIWGFVKRDGLSAAIIPTHAPEALDRFATAMALSSGAAFAGLALWWLFRPRVDQAPVNDSKEPTGSPLPARP
jgi:uncharacterized membrane protein (UPF0136 family)